MNLIAGREAEEDVTVILLQKSDGKSQVRRSKGAGHLPELAKPWKSCLLIENYLSHLGTALLGCL